MKKVAVITGEGFQDAEALMPIAYLVNRGIEISVIGTETKEVKAYNSDFTIKIQYTPKNTEIDDYDAMLIPGGKAPSELRKDDGIVEFVKEFYESGKPVAAICHGPQILITAGVMEGVKATCYKSVANELKEAGANYVDQAPVIDGNLITARNPDDIAAFSKAIYEASLK